MDKAKKRQLENERGKEFKADIIRTFQQSRANSLETNTKLKISVKKQKTLTKGKF